MLSAGPVFTLHFTFYIRFLTLGLSKLLGLKLNGASDVQIRYLVAWNPIILLAIRLTLMAAGS